MREKVKDGDYAYIGQPLGVVEEYLPDKNSTYSSEGIIYASKSGTVRIDLKRKKIFIEDYNEKHTPALIQGDIVIGIVGFVRKYSVGVNIEVVNNRIVYNSNFFGNIHVSHVSKSYIEKVEDGFQKTDVIRAKVVSMRLNEIDLTTEDRDLGVIAADCSICGTPLQKIKKDLLKCPRCENIEKRKLATDYGSVENRLIL